MKSNLKHRSSSNNALRPEADLEQIGNELHVACRIYENGEMLSQALRDKLERSDCDIGVFVIALFDSMGCEAQAIMRVVMTREKNPLYTVQHKERERDSGAFGLMHHSVKRSVVYCLFCW